MAVILSNSGRPAYGIKRLMVRTIEDILNIPLTPTLRPGSTVFVSSTEQRFILDEAYHWVEIGEMANSPEASHIVYEGGDLEQEPGAGDLEYEGGNLQ
jgi:hypothetical protein